MKNNLGQELSKEQIEYFKNSKVVDKEGNLLVCYHGTPQQGFKEFDARKGDSQFGKYKFKNANVNYFTTNKKAATSYTYMGYERDGNVYACYINIVNPYIVNNTSESEIKSALNIKDERLRKRQIELFDKLIDKYEWESLEDIDLDEFNEDLLTLNLEARIEDEYLTIYHLGNNGMFGSERYVYYQYVDDDLFDDYDNVEEFREYVIGEDDEYSFSTDEIVRYVLSLDEYYDGIIIEDIFDSKDLFSGNGTDVITLRSSNQIKEISNLNPTSSNRIDEDVDDDIEKIQNKIKELKEEKRLNTVEQLELYRELIQYIDLEQKYTDAKDTLPEEVYTKYERYWKLHNEYEAIVSAIKFAEKKERELKYQLEMSPSDIAEFVLKQLPNYSDGDLLDLVPNLTIALNDYSGPLFIMPNGNIIDVVDSVGSGEWCVHKEFIDVISQAIMEKDYKGKKKYDAGDVYYVCDEIMDELTYERGWLRVNMGDTPAEQRFYCVLPNKITEAQLGALKRVIDYEVYDEGTHDDFEMFGDYGQDYINYSLDEETPEQIIRNIRDYYRTGYFLESLQEDSNKVTAYHGSAKKFDKFDLSYFNTGNADGGMLGRGLYFTESPKLAKAWSEKGYLYKCELTFNNPLRLRNDEEREAFYDKYGKGNSIDTDSVIKDGYDGIISTNETWETNKGNETHNQYVVFNDNNIKILSCEEYNNELDEEFEKATKNYYNKNSLQESKQDQQAFIDKFGQDQFDLFLKSKDRLKNANISTDITYHIKNTSVEDMKNILNNLRAKVNRTSKDKEVDLTKIPGEYRYLGSKGGYDVYQPLDVESSMALGAGTGWCTTGRYEHYGDVNFKPSYADAKKHWNDYTSKGIEFYYFLQDGLGKYALALYPKTFKVDKFIDENNYLKKTNFELFNAEDYLDYEAINKLPLDIIDAELVIDKLPTKDGLLVKNNELVKCFNKSVNVTIPNGIKSIGDAAFWNCKSLTNIIIPNSVTDIGRYAFSQCESLKSVTLPNSVVWIGRCAFECCTSLINITIPDSVINMEWGVFRNCTSLTSITLSNSEMSIWGATFSGCTSLTSITLPNGVDIISGYAFENCTSLKSITIPDSVLSIESCAFYNCKSLTSIKIPNKVTSIETYAFYNCTSLTSIEIPDSVTSIEKFAFENCPKLTVYTSNKYVTKYCKDNGIKVSTLNESLTEERLDEAQGVTLKNALSHYFGQRRKMVSNVKGQGTNKDTGHNDLDKHHKDNKHGSERKDDFEIMSHSDHSIITNERTKTILKRFKELFGNELEDKEVLNLVVSIINYICDDESTEFYSNRKNSNKDAFEKSQELVDKIQRVLNQIENELKEELTESKADLEKFRQWAGDELANRFYKQKDRLEGKEKDIYYWMSRGEAGKQELLMTLREYEKMPTRKEVDQKGKEGAKKIYEDDEWKVYAIYEYEAAVKYGKNTQWCISASKNYGGSMPGRDFWNGYQSSDIYFYINKKNNSKYALVYDSKDHWTLYDDADCIEVGNYIDYANDEDSWSPYDASKPHFPDVEGLPDINAEYDRAEREIKDYFGDELDESLNNYNIPVYRVDSREGEGNDEWKNDTRFFADSLEYYDHSDTRYDKSKAKKYLLNTKDFKVFDPMVEWKDNLEVESWSVIRTTEEFCDEKELQIADYLDDVDYDNPNEYHEVLIDTDSLAAYGLDNGYDITIIRDIPQYYVNSYGDHDYSDNDRKYTEYAVHNSKAVKLANAKKFDKNSDDINEDSNKKSITLFRNAPVTNNSKIGFFFYADKDLGYELWNEDDKIYKYKLSKNANIYECKTSEQFIKDNNISFEDREDVIGWTANNNLKQQLVYETLRDKYDGVHYIEEEGDYYSDNQDWKNGQYQIWNVDVLKGFKETSLYEYLGEPLNKRHIKHTYWESLKEDYGYHAGDLGKAEYYGRQSGGRGTGHFGTGTYFVGNPEKIKNYNKRNGEQAPQHKVDFSKYHLYKPSNNDIAYKLHDTLGLLDGVYTWYLPILKEITNVVKQSEDYLYDGTPIQNLSEFIDDLNKCEEYYDNEGIDKEKALRYLDDEKFDEYLDEIDPDEWDNAWDEKYEVEKTFKEKLKDYKNWRLSSDVKKINTILDDLYKALEGKHSKEEIQSALDKVVEVSKEYKTRNADKEDSLATVFMKALGYEGVDTRHLNKDENGTAGLDNTSYGSVIYDLKPETIVEDLEMSNEYDSEGNQLTKQQADYFRNSKVRDNDGNLLVCYHGTNAYFNTFEKGDIGFHFGSKKQAIDRMKSIKKGNNLIRCYLNITNWLVFGYDLMYWDFDNLKDVLVGDLTIEDDSEEENQSEYRQMIGRQFEKETLQKYGIGRDEKDLETLKNISNDKAMRDYLLSKGIDGIMYYNDFEGFGEEEVEEVGNFDGRYSYIIFRPDQVKYVDNKTPTSSNRMDEELLSTEDFDMFVAISPYQAKNYLLGQTESQRIFADENLFIYLIAPAYETIHGNMIDIAKENGYETKFDDYDSNKVCLIFVPDTDGFFDEEGDAFDDDYDYKYVFNGGQFVIYSRYQDFSNFDLCKAFGNNYEAYHRVDEDSDAYREGILFEK